ncbi:MAG TPA: hypothetical protein VGX46_11215, partial [Vicinamibacterales bacterium]|nr:hypothetical protein [Vicinamibacterales bacterium]
MAGHLAREVQFVRRQRDHRATVLLLVGSRAVGFEGGARSGQRVGEKSQIPFSTQLDGTKRLEVLGEP